MPRFGKFLKASGKKGISLMTGGIFSLSIAVYEHLEGASLIFLLFFGVGCIAVLLGSYFAWDEENKRADAALFKIHDLEKPPNRPQVSFSRWGQRETGTGSQLFQYGFYLNNHGGVALQVFIEKFKIGKFSVTNEPLPEIPAGMNGFIPIWLEEKGPLTKYNIKEVLEAYWEERFNDHKVAWGQPVEIAVSVIYRDFANLGYRSECDLKYHKGVVTFSSVIQTSLGLVKPSKLGFQQLTDESNSSNVHK
jgi:hypothetical protein